MNTAEQGERYQLHWGKHGDDIEKERAREKRTRKTVRRREEGRKEKRE